MRPISDGLLDVCLVGDIWRLAALRELPGIYRGDARQPPAGRDDQVRELRIEGEAGHARPSGRRAVRHAAGRRHACGQAAVAVAAPIG